METFKRLFRFQLQNNNLGSRPFEQAGTGPSWRHIQGSKIAE